MNQFDDVTASGALLGDLSWPAVAAMLSRGAIPVVTIGAAAKEHGYHLPMQTDAIQAQWLGNAIAARYHVLVWPTLTIGCYPAFLDYPGSVSVRAEIFRDLLLDLLGSIARHTPAPMLVVNTGISTIDPLEQLQGEFMDENGGASGVVLHHVYRGAHLQACAERICEQHHGGHGDEVETSVMLAIAPDKVRLNLAQAYDNAMASGPLSRTPGAPNYTPQGVWGNPLRASRSKGRALLDAMLRDLDDSFASIVDLTKTDLTAAVMANIDVVNHDKP